MFLLLVLLRLLLLFLLLCCHLYFLLLVLHLLCLLHLLLLPVIIVLLLLIILLVVVVVVVVQRPLFSDTPPPLVFLSLQRRRTAVAKAFLHGAALDQVLGVFGLERAVWMGKWDGSSFQGYCSEVVKEEWCGVQQEDVLTFGGVQFWGGWRLGYRSAMQNGVSRPRIQWAVFLHFGFVCAKCKQDTYGQEQGYPPTAFLQCFRVRICSHHQYYAMPGFDFQPAST